MILPKTDSAGDKLLKLCPSMQTVVQGSVNSHVFTLLDLISSLIEDIHCQGIMYRGIL